MESKEVEQKVKQSLRKIYLDLNPAQLKREIDDKLNKLFKVYQQKNKNFIYIKTEFNQEPLWDFLGLFGLVFIFIFKIMNIFIGDGEIGFAPG